MSDIEVEFDFGKETQYFHIIQEITKPGYKQSMELETCKYWIIWSVLDILFNLEFICFFYELCYEFSLSLASMYDIDV